MDEPTNNQATQARHRRDHNHCAAPTIHLAGDARPCSNDFSAGRNAPRSADPQSHPLRCGLEPPLQPDLHLAEAAPDPYPPGTGYHAGWTDHPLLRDLLDPWRLDHQVQRGYWSIRRELNVRWATLRALLRAWGFRT